MHPFGLYLRKLHHLGKSIEVFGSVGYFIFSFNADFKMRVHYRLERLIAIKKIAITKSQSQIWISKIFGRNV